MAFVNAAYVDMGKVWGYDPNTRNAQGFYDNAWVWGDMAPQGNDFLPCSYFYVVGQKDNLGFTPTSIDFNTASGLLSVQGTQEGVERIFLRNYMVGAPAPRFLNVRVNQRSRRLADLPVVAIITDNDETLPNIRGHLGMLDEEEGEVAEAEESTNPKDYITISFLDQQGNGHPTTLLNAYDLRFGERGSTYFKALREALDEGVKRGDYEGYKIKKTTSKPLMDADYDYETSYNNEYGYQVWLMGDKFYYGDSDIPVVNNKYTINEGEPKFADMIYINAISKNKTEQPMDGLGSLFGAEDDYEKARRIMKLLRVVKRKATGSYARYAKTYADAAEMAYYDYGFKGLKAQVAYVLSNLGGWRGDEAKQVKAELRKLIK